MKCIEAVIMPESLDNVRHRLTDIAVEGLTVPEARLASGIPEAHIVLQIENA
jgi:nitrogen regulatory protein PII